MSLKGLPIQLKTGSSLTRDGEEDAAESRHDQPQLTVTLSLGSFIRMKHRVSRAYALSPQLTSKGYG